MTKANLTKVKVYPKDFKSIPDILPYNKLLHGDPVELELDKKEILRCMNFGDVYDLTSGEEVLIDEVTFHDIVEFVEEEDSTTEEPTDPEPSNPTDPDPSEPTEGDQTDEKDPSQEVTDPDTGEEETPSSEGEESTDPAAGTDSEQNAESESEVSTQDLDASEAVVKKSSRKKAVVEE